MITDTEWKRLDYHLTTGELCPVVATTPHSKKPFFFCSFGRAEYDSKKPVLKDHTREAVQPLVDKLNAGTISTEEAREQLAKMYWA